MSDTLAMKKHSKKNGHDQQQQQNLDPENPESSPFTRSCSPALSRLFGLQCVIVLVLSFALILSAIFWLFPRRSPSNFDADDDIVKLNASVQAYFRLHKPASEVVYRKRRLEHDIFQSIGHLNTKVTILSLHQSGVSNYTDVKFAVLPVPPDYTFNEESLSSLRSSFIKLFVKRSKLNLTTSSLGQTTSFQVLKFPGGISVDPLRSKPVPGVLMILVGCTFEKSISEIQDRVAQLKGQLEHILCLEPFEFFHFLLTNEQGSTISRPITVQVYIFSIMRNHLQPRLDHFAKIIQASSAKNLGLDSAVFGEVKSITFSTYLDGKILDSAPVLAPTPTSCFPSLC